MRIRVRSTRIAGIQPTDIVRWLPAVVLAPFPLVFLLVAVSRIGTPLGLEWNEGHSLEQALRFARGAPLYPAPDEGWVPYMYGPLFHWVWGAVIWATGWEGLWVGRVVSLTATLATAVAVGLAIWRATASPSATACGVCLYFATFSPTGCWHDLARVDSLATALMLWGLVLLPGKRAATWRSPVCWGLLGLSVMAKQSMAPVALLGWGWILWRDWRNGRLLVVATVLAGASLLLVMNRTGSSWFWFWVFDAPRQHVSDWGSVLGGRLWREVLAPTLVPLVLIGWRLCLARKVPVSREEVLLVGALVLVAGAGVAALAKAGGFRNNLMPSFAVLAIMTGIAVGVLCRRSTGHVVPVTVACLLALQIWQPWGGERWVFDVRGQIPSRDAWSGMRGFERWLRERHEAGERVLVVHHQWIGERDGHPVSYNLDMVRVAEWAGVPVPWEALRPISEGEYDWLVLDRELEEEWLPTRLSQRIGPMYRRVGSVDSVLGIPHRHLQPVTGAVMGPRYLWSLGERSEREE